jgi:SAM-dependent methyltransferase
MAKPEIIKVDESRWREAQKSEMGFARETAQLGDDFNHWWYSAFENYQAIHNLTLENVLEVGCGPHTNIRLILPHIRFKNIWLEDPLINYYLKLKKQTRKFRILKINSPMTVSNLVKNNHAFPLPEPLEELSLADEIADLCVCINVLDHVRDADLCFQQMRRVLKKGGILIIGQDMSNAEDMQLCPESWTDVGHPIKMDAGYLDAQTRGLSALYKKTLSRGQGRNPKCHYGTYLFIGQKD